MRSTPLRLIAACTATAAVGVGGGALLNAGAATPAGGHTASATAKHAAGKAGKKPGAAKRHARGGRAVKLARRSVHGELVVPTKDGTFTTVTVDRGVVQGVSGDQLTVLDRTRKASYKAATITVPSGARVRVNRKKATLADVKAGQRVIVVQGPKVVTVVARDAKRG